MTTLSLANELAKCQEENVKLRAELAAMKEIAAEQSSTILRLYEAHNALKDAAKGLLAIHKRHKGLTVYSEQDYRDIWSERVDALAALVGEE